MSESVKDFYNQLHGERRGEAAHRMVMPVVRQVADLLPQSATVLDVGAGQGANALYLAERGFTVEAVDVSDEAVAQMSEEAIERGIQKFSTRVTDGKTDLIREKYDLIISTYMFHHVTPEVAVELLDAMKENTNAQGFNILSVWLNKGIVFDRSEAKGLSRFFPGPGALQKLYTGWDIRMYKESERSTGVQLEDGTPGRNWRTILLAQKP